MDGRFGQYNQAGDLAPRSSEYGRALRATRTTARATPLVDPQHDNQYRGFVGVLFERPASVTTIVMPGAYGGDLPVTLQGTVHAPDPWTIGGGSDG